MADEKNPTSKNIIMKRVEGYMTRAEQLRTMLQKNTVPKSDGTAELEKYEFYIALLSKLCEDRVMWLEEKKAKRRRPTRRWPKFVDLLPVREYILEVEYAFVIFYSRCCLRKAQREMGWHCWFRGC